MAETQKKKHSGWPDLSLQGLKMSRHGQKPDPLRVVISALDGDIPAEVHERLEEIGFVKMTLDGRVVQTKSGKLLEPDLKRALRYDRYLPVGSDFRIGGTLEPYVEPEVDEVLSDDEAAVFANIDLDAEDEQVADEVAAPEVKSSPEPRNAVQPEAPEKVETPAKPVPAAQKAEQPSKPKAKRGAPAAKPVDPADLQARPGWEAFEELRDFDAFLTHEGVPSQARSEFVAAMQVIRATFDFEDIFVKKHDDPKKAFGAKLREMFLKETKRKELATMRIIDCLYPFAKEFLARDRSNFPEYRAFAEANAADVEDLCNWMESVAEDFHDRYRDREGKEIANFMSTYQRNIRMTGARPFMNFVAAQDQNPMFKRMKENDARFSELVGNQARNYMSPVVTKLRGDPGVVSQLRERRDALFGAPQPEVELVPAR